MNYGLDVIAMLNIYLTDHEYDGLLLEGKCSCKVYDLAPCGDIQLECQAWYFECQPVVPVETHPVDKGEGVPLKTFPDD